ncbi:MAG: glucokinase [bacterium]|nr:glucokinase [bacterium]
MIIAGYITATTVDLVRAKTVRNEIKLTGLNSYRNADFSSFDDILKQYLKRVDSDIEYLCLGVAGPVISSEVRPTNLPWTLVSFQLESDFSIGRVKLINDLVASAYGLRKLKADKLITINRGTPDEFGNLGLLAAGDGLGESLIYRDEKNFYPYASEGGHTDFAPTSQLEAELWAFFCNEKGAVETEDILSFGGIDAIYRFLHLRKSVQPPEWFQESAGSADRIIELALAGKDDIAARTLDIFTGCLASEAANLALKGMTLGGIYLGGLIPKQIMTAIDKKQFMDRFVKPGKMSDLLEKIPVRLIIDDKTALLGAAALALEKTSV